MTIRDIAIAFGFNVDEQSAKKAENTVKNLKDTATKLLGAIGIGFSLVGLNEIAEEFNGVNDQIRNATQGLGDQEEIQQKILDAANGAKMSYKDTAKFVGALVQENKDLFATVEDATEYAGLTAKLFASAGKSQEDIASLQEAINKSFAKGIVDTETINQLYERAPEAINMIADSLGVAKESLAKMASDGSLSLADLKNAFVKNAEAINQQFDGLDFSISDALLNIRNQWGLFVDDMNGTLGITKTISEFMVRGFSTVMGGLKRALDWIDRVAKRLGGVQNLFKLVGAAGAAIFLALNGGKILDFLKKAVGGLKGINKQMLLTQLKTLAIIAVIMAVFLIIDDFINFMKGNDSVIGVLFEKAGIDADKARETIKAAWKAITNFLSKAWETIKQVGEKIWGALSRFWAENGEEIMDTLAEVWGAIWTVLGAIWDALSDAAHSIFDALKAFWDQWGTQIMAQFRIIWDTISGIFGGFIQVVQGIIDFIAGIFTGDWERVWQGIKEIFSGIWTAISSFFMGIWDTIYNWFGDKIEAIKTTLENGFNSAIDFMKSLPGQALQWGKDFMDGLVNGIKEKGGAVVDAVKGVGEKIKSFLHFSVPDEGPLTDYESWMPDFMGGLARGIRENSPKVVEAIKALTKDMAVVSDVIVKSSTASAVMGGGSRTTNVSQTNNIKNEFHGSDRAAQTQGAKAMGKSAEDATDYLARGLAYGR